MAWVIRSPWAYIGAMTRAILCSPFLFLGDGTQVIGGQLPLAIAIAEYTGCNCG